MKGPAAGEFEPATFPSDPSPKTTPQSDRTTRVVSRPGLPEGLKPGTTSTTSPSRLSLNSAASFTDAAGLSSSLADPQGRLQHQDSRKQLRHSVSGTDLSEFGQNRVQDGSLHSGSDRPLSFFGSAPSNHLSVGSSTGRQDSFPVSVSQRVLTDPNA